MSTLNLSVTKIDNGFTVTSTKYNNATEDGFDYAYTPPATKTLYAPNLEEIGDKVTQLLLENIA